MTNKKKTSEDEILDSASDAVFLGSLGFIATELKDEFDDEPFTEEKTDERKAALEKKKKTKEFGEW